MAILLICRHISTTVPLHHLNSHKMTGEKARWELKVVVKFWMKNSRCIAIYLPSHKPPKKDKQDTLGTAGGVKKIS